MSVTPSAPRAPRIVTADTLCTAAEQTLRERLHLLIDALGVSERFKPIAEWQQVPVQSALVTADVPAVTISSPGLIGRPKTSASAGTTATWRINVGIFDRGRNHHDTSGKVRDWAAYVRAVLVDSRTLGGAATSVVWATEEYALYPQKDAARTFGASLVGFDVTATNVLDLSHLDPQVLRAEPALTVHP